MLCKYHFHQHWYRVRYIFSLINTLGRKRLFTPFSKIRLKGFKYLWTIQKNNWHLFYYLKYFYFYFQSIYHTQIEINIHILEFKIHFFYLWMKIGVTENISCSKNVLNFLKNKPVLKIFIRKKTKKKGRTIISCYWTGLVSPCSRDQVGTWWMESNWDATTRHYGHTVTEIDEHRHY